jgi:hypothetical protein
MFQRVANAVRCGEVRGVHVFGFYSAISLGQFAVSNYRSGRRALKVLREKSTEVDKPRERRVIQDACQRESGENLWDAIFWPASLIQKVTPGVVSLTTPR